MKVITENQDEAGEVSKLSKYVFEDSKVVTMESDRIVVGDPSSPDFYIADLNSNNATLTENVTDVPSNWIGNRYTYDPAADPKWVQDPDWIDPEA
jgi:hypothetical protein|tara:strand:+ start:236 stop:520 length:285 start_codon:yes stop_codon:yes gene_type:complete